MTESSAGPPGGRPSETQNLHLPRVLPTAESVLWNPTSPASMMRRPAVATYPIFVEQKAVTAVHAHYQTSGRQGMMGFLVGDLYECPASKVRYVVIDSTIRLNQAVYGDKTLVIVSRLWNRIQEELRKTEGHLIGWYHSHPPIAVELAPGDVETHLQYFKRPWHVALVLGSEHEGEVAGLFRPGPGETAPTVSLPFHELIDNETHLANGRKHSILPWINFTTEDTTMVHGDPDAAVSGLVAPNRSTLEVVGPPAARPSATQPRPAVPSPAPPAAPPRASATQPRPAVTPPPAPAMPGKPAERPAAAPPGAPKKPVMRPPKDALSNLPLLAVGQYDVGEVEARASDPRVITPKPLEAFKLPPRVKRSSHPTGAPVATLIRPRHRHRRRGLWATLLGISALGGAAAWYFLVRLPAIQSAVRGGGATGTALRPPADTTAPVLAHPMSDATLVEYDRVGDSVSQIVRGYQDRARLFGARQLDCGGLANGLTTTEDIWTRYNVVKRKAPPLDATRNARDQTLYSAVDSVERHFDRSGCARP